MTIKTITYYKKLNKETGKWEHIRDKTGNIKITREIKGEYNE